MIFISGNATATDGTTTNVGQLTKRPVSYSHSHVTWYRQRLNKAIALVDLVRVFVDTQHSLVLSCSLVKAPNGIVCGCEFKHARKAVRTVIS